MVFAVTFCKNGQCRPLAYAYVVTTLHALAREATSYGEVDGDTSAGTSTVRSTTMGNTTNKIKKGMKDTAGAVKHAAEKSKDAAVRAVEKGKAAAARVRIR